MTRPNPTDPPQPLDYGREERASVGWWRRARAEVGERTDGIFVFLGQMIGLIGEIRQVIFAFGFATLAGGLGICLERGFDTSGPLWMWLGGFVAGACVPIFKRR